jgi:ribosomal-protein-alanine N-acetyltransferase
MFRDLNAPTAHKAGCATSAHGRQRSGADPVSLFAVPSPTEWWHGLPELASPQVRLRELRPTDAAAMAAALGCPEVGEHLSPGPTSLAETAAFIEWSRRARTAGRYICFGVVPRGMSEPVGVFQMWPLEPSFRTVEWGFALRRASWGTGLFAESARLVLQFGFETLGVVRLEARAAVDNVRGNRALQKLGAVPEGVLRKCFFANGKYRDHVMWSLLADDWRLKRAEPGEAVVGEVA